jgi:FlaA1/EpsC-like NDP-sugar epimerase
MPWKSEDERATLPRSVLIPLAVVGAIGLARAFSDTSNPNWLAYMEALGALLALIGIYLAFKILRWAWRKHFDVVLTGLAWTGGLIGAVLVMAFSDFIEGRKVNFSHYFGFALSLFFVLWLLREVIASGVEKGVRAASVKG